MSWGTENTLGAQKTTENGRRSCLSHDSAVYIGTDILYTTVNYDHIFIVVVIKVGNLFYSDLLMEVPFPFVYLLSCGLLLYVCGLPSLKFYFMRNFSDIIYMRWNVATQILAEGVKRPSS